MSSQPHDDAPEFDHAAAFNAGVVRDVPAIVGNNLKRLRKAHGYSLERLAERSKVSRAMLGQIETGKSVPTVSLLWRIADALGVSVAGLLAVENLPPITVLRREQTAVTYSGVGNFKRRALFHTGRKRTVDFFEISIEPGHTEKIESLPSAGEHYLVLAYGELVVTVGDEPSVRLTKGDAAIFDADITSSITNDTESVAVAFAVLAHGT
ncbi:MAG: XRE family transcriptional regulator [Hyphomicrobiaceae bacterium]|nr:XRE family transcriptional regulator [Hyphomicrobiaceae bacterium]